MLGIMNAFVKQIQFFSFIFHLFLTFWIELIKYLMSYGHRKLNFIKIFSYILYATTPAVLSFKFTRKRERESGWRVLCLPKRKKQKSKSDWSSGVKLSPYMNESNRQKDVSLCNRRLGCYNFQKYIAWSTTFSFN